MGRNLTTTRAQVFGDVSAGTECRVCGRDVDDGRRKHCSDYCANIVSAVMSFLNWPSVRKRIIRRDEEICQQCGWDAARERRARDHIRSRIDAFAGPEPEGPSILEVGNDTVDAAEMDRAQRATRAWQRARAEGKRRYGDPYERPRELEVDHITRVADGGHPFDPANLQTLCSVCHEAKTTTENSERATPDRAELNESILEYVEGDR